MADSSMTQTEGGALMTPERLHLLSTINVEAHALIALVRNTFKSNSGIDLLSSLEMLMGLMHRLEGLNALQFSIVGEDDTTVRNALSRLHGDGTIQFKGVAA